MYLGNNIQEILEAKTKVNRLKQVLQTSTSFSFTYIYISVGILDPWKDTYFVLYVGRVRCGTVVIKVTTVAVNYVRDFNLILLPEFLFFETYSSCISFYKTSVIDLERTRQYLLESPKSLPGW